MSVALDGLNLGVEVFGEGIGDAVPEVGEKAAEISFERLGHFLHFEQLASHDAAMLGMPATKLDKLLWVKGLLVLRFNDFSANRIVVNVVNNTDNGEVFSIRRA